MSKNLHDTGFGFDAGGETFQLMLGQGNVPFFVTNDEVVYTIDLFPRLCAVASRRDPVFSLTIRADHEDMTKWHAKDGIQVMEYRVRDTSVYRLDEDDGEIWVLDFPSDVASAHAVAAAALRNILQPKP